MSQQNSSTHSCTWLSASHMPPSLLPDPPALSAPAPAAPDPPAPPARGVREAREQRRGVYPMLRHRGLQGDAQETAKCQAQPACWPPPLLHAA